MHITHMLWWQNGLEILNFDWESLENFTWKLHTMSCAHTAKHVADWTIGFKGDVRMTLAWLRHQMETFSALLALCAGNSPVTGEFPAQRPVTRSFDVFFDLSLNKRMNEQSWGWWFETPSRPLWRHCNGMETTWAQVICRKVKRCTWLWLF